MTNLQLSLACGAYDRTLALADGTVRPAGIDLNFMAMYPGELFRRQARNAEFDVAEFSMSTYCILRARGDDRMTAIPVFPSRKFRHSHIFVNRERVAEPGDLRGKRVGTSDYQQTAAVWIRGILADEYGVGPADVEWVSGGLNAPKPEGDRIPITLPDDVTLTRIGPDQCLSDLLAAGGIDAIVNAQIPDALGQHSHVGRLFDDPVEVEKDYFDRTGIFPIMHLVVIKKQILEQYPWVANNLYEAFGRAAEAGRARLRYPGTLYVSLPWLSQHIEEADEVAGGADLFASGVAANRSHLETFLRYEWEQGLLERPLEVDELFSGVES